MAVIPALGALTAGYTTFYLGPSHAPASAPAMVNVEGAASWFGCPSAYVCVYAQGRHDSISASDITKPLFYTYGASGLEQIGWHWVLNNQIEGAHVALCTGGNGSGDCHVVINAQGKMWVDLTPIKSIILYK